MTSTSEASRPRVVFPGNLKPYGSVPSGEPDDIHRLDGVSGGNSSNKIQRGLSARQVQTIAVGGTIDTGLFWGTGRSLAEGGPGSIFVCYTLVGFIVYVTLMLLGEMRDTVPLWLVSFHFSSSRGNRLRAVQRKCLWFRRPLHRVVYLLSFKIFLPFVRLRAVVELLV